MEASVRGEEEKESFYAREGTAAHALAEIKAMGYDEAGGMEPGGGPLTDQHNMQFQTPDAAEVSARLLAARASAAP